MLGEKLLRFVTEAENIKGELYGAKAMVESWSKRLVGDVGRPHGHRDTPRRFGGAMACTSGFIADEALQAASHTCVICGVPKIGISTVMFMGVLAEGNLSWCRQCYSDACKDDPNDRMGAP